MNRIQFFPHTPLIPTKKQAVVSTERQSFRDELAKAEQNVKNKQTCSTTIARTKYSY
ncbi:hypothetical protein LR68_00396 [Anoxybacillus sp. BCO1]|nr:hypothetical protein LR68_00396 [Anoxybacillus sp. BCO1]